MLKRFHLDELFGKQDGDCVFNSTELEVFVLHPSIKTLRRPESPSQLTCTLDRPGHQKLLKDLYVFGQVTYMETVPSSTAKFRIVTYVFVS